MPQTPGLPPQKYTLFALWLPDYPTDEACAARAAHMAEHLASPMLADPEIVRVGSIMLSTPDTDANEGANAGAPHTSAGSCVISQAPSLAAAWALVRADVFWREGVWDKERARVVPIAAVMDPKPLL